MTKKVLLGMFAAAGLLATSCSDDELSNSLASGDYVNASFAIETPEGILTRAIGDGTQADKVACAIFCNGSELAELRDTVTVTGKKATYNVRLAKGQKYQAVFFAYNSNANAYDLTSMEAIRVKDNQSSNAENRDAFTASVEVTAANTNINQDVTLYRPFAQLNIGSTAQDIADAKAAGIEVEQTSVTVSNVYTTFNAVEDKVAGQPSTVTYNLADIPTEKLKVTVNGTETEFTYLALNYLLVGDKDAEKSLTDVEFTVKPKTGSNNTATFENVPVQRNYRTNIIGALLTNPALFNIVIDSDFDEPDHVYDLDVVAKVASDEELSNAISDGKSEILLGEGTYTLPASAKGKTLTFVGTGDASKTVIKAVKNGEGDYSLDGSTALFENLSITVGDSNGDFNGFVRCNGTFKNCIINNQLTLYGNSTFEGCTFNVEGNAYNVWTWGAKKATFNNCTFNSDGKSMLLYGGAGSSENPTTILTINNCTFNDNGTTAYGKTAIEIGNDYNATYELIVNNTKVEGFEQNSNGIPTGTTLWSNKNSMDKDHLSVTVDGTKVY